MDSPPDCPKKWVRIQSEYKKRKERCSFRFLWSEWLDSNQRPLEPHSSAIPNFATPGSRCSLTAWVFYHISRKNASGKIKYFSEFFFLFEICPVHWYGHRGVCFWLLPWDLLKKEARLRRYIDKEIKVVLGDYGYLKITTQEDLKWQENILEEKNIF